MIDYAKSQGSQVKCEGICGQTMPIDYTTVIERTGPHDLMTVFDECKEKESQTELSLIAELDKSEITVTLTGKECGALIAIAIVFGLGKNSLPEIESGRDKLLTACSDRMAELKNSSVLDSDLTFAPEPKK